MADDYSFWHVHLELSALDADFFLVESMFGREEISRLYEYVLEVAPREGTPLVLDEFDEIMGGTATISFGPDRDHPVHGVVRAIEMNATQDASEVTYTIRIVPRFWDAQLTRGSWIYQEKSVPEIIGAALSEIMPETEQFAEGDDFDLGVKNPYNPREYVVQYEESIFHFVSRQAEHWGISYYFDHLGEKERLVFLDLQSDFPQLSGFEQVQFNATHAAEDQECLYKISARQQMVEAKVHQRDYNYRTPSLPLVTKPADVDEKGRGEVHETGAHFDAPAEGGVLNQFRSEGMFAHKMRMSAESRVRGLRAGHRFTLVGGTPEFLGLARDYLVLAVEHHYNSTTANGGGDGYHNKLTLLPYEVSFRPDRLTPKPRIYGVMHAKIDSETGDDELNVPVDEWGRYKIVMPFDVAGETGGKSSCWVRLSTPSTGGAWGMAMQLHYGMEVAVYHIDGDPDRPVIAGALPNFENRSTITQENPNQNVFSSRGGVVMTFNDG